MSFVLLGLAPSVNAALAPELIVNDAKKECQMYSPNAREELLSDWHYSGIRFSDMRNNPPDKYCNSLGYNFRQSEKVSSIKPVFKIVAIIFWIIFIGLTYIYYIILLRIKKKYVIFSLCFLATALVLSGFIYPLVIYQISPCASGWAIC